MKHLAEACAGDLDHQRGRAWPALIRQRPLGMAERGAAPHAEPAVEPRLARQPLQRLDAILALMTQRIERAARLEAPARSLHHDDVSPARPEPADGVGRKAVPEGAAERNADENCRRRAVHLRPIDVGDEGHRVRRGQGHVAFDGDGVFGRANAFRRQDEAGDQRVAAAERQHRDQHRKRPNEAAHAEAAPRLGVNTARHHSRSANICL